MTAIMSSPMGNDAWATWGPALAGEEPDPALLPPARPVFLDHLRELATTPPPVTREEQIETAVATWRVLHGDVLPFDEERTRRFCALGFDRAADPGAAAQHDHAGRAITADRLAPLSSIAAPTLVIHGAEDPLNPLPHGEALAAEIPGAELLVVDGVGHAFPPELDRPLAEAVLRHTAR